MESKPTWKSLRPLSEYRFAPKSPGIYEIGFRRLCYVSKQAAAFGLHAATYPHDFMPMYVGKSESSINKRLGEHFIGTDCSGKIRRGSKANKIIKEYFREYLPHLQRNENKIPESHKYVLDGLYFTCIPVKDTKSFEALIRLGHFEYAWNKRKEHKSMEIAIGNESTDFGYVYKSRAVLFIDS